MFSQLKTIIIANINIVELYKTAFIFKICINLVTHFFVEIVKNTFFHLVLVFCWVYEKE